MDGLNSSLNINQRKQEREKDFLVVRFEREDEAREVGKVKGRWRDEEVVREVVGKTKLGV